LKKESGEGKSKPESEPDQGATEAFEKFWRIYPKRVAKEAARKAFAKAVKDSVDPEVIIAGAKRYAITRGGQDPKYTKHPATWLNAGCWQDEPDGAVVIDGITGEPVAVAPPRRPDRDKTWKEIGEELLAEMDARDAAEQAGAGDDTVH
jgi:hypothetical protein